MLQENAFQSTVDPFGVHIALTKRDHTGQRRPTGSKQFPKAQVVDQQNAPFLAGLRHNVMVWKPLEPLDDKMDRIVSQGV